MVQPIKTELPEDHCCRDTQTQPSHRLRLQWHKRQQSHKPCAGTVYLPCWLRRGVVSSNIIGSCVCSIHIELTLEGNIRNNDKPNKHKHLIGYVDAYPARGRGMQTTRAAVSPGCMYTIAAGCWLLSRAQEKNPSHAPVLLCFPNMSLLLSPPNTFVIQSPPPGQVSRSVMRTILRSASTISGRGDPQAFGDTCLPRNNTCVHSRHCCWCTIF